MKRAPLLTSTEQTNKYLKKTTKDTLNDYLLYYFFILIYLPVLKIVLFFY